MDTEEIANALTHGAGLVLSLGGLVFLIVVTALHGNVINIVSCCVYGVTLVGLYAASTTYHTPSSPHAGSALSRSSTTAASTC